MSFPYNIVDLNHETSGLLVPSTTKLYPLGTVGICDSRRFVYAHSLDSLISAQGAKCELPQAVGWSTVATTTVAGAQSITLDVSATGGIAGDGVIVANQMAQGHYCIIDSTDGSFIQGRIESNTATDGGGDEMTITLSHPCPVALIADTDHIELVHSLYYGIKQTNNDISSVVGVPTYNAVSGQYLWLQTWGPCALAAMAAVGGSPGPATGNNRLAIFRHNGSVDELDYSDNYNAHGQVAGWVMQNAVSGGQGTPFIFLTIS